MNNNYFKNTNYENEKTFTTGKKNDTIKSQNSFKDSMDRISALTKPGNMTIKNQTPTVKPKEPNQNKPTEQNAPSSNTFVPKEKKEQDRLLRATGSYDLKRVNPNEINKHLKLTQKTPDDYYSMSVPHKELIKRLDNEALGPKTDFSVWNYENNYDKLNKEEQGMLIHKMQLDLNNQGYKDYNGHSLKPDGIFGKKTESAYNQYRKDKQEELEDYNPKDRKIVEGEDYEVLKNEDGKPVLLASTDMSLDGIKTNEQIVLNEKELQYPQFIQKAIIKSKEDWINASRIEDFETMDNSHYAAERARMLGDRLISRQEWGAKDFGDWVKDEKKTDIVIHHSDNFSNIKQIEKSHINRKEPFSGIGYHFVISTDGKIYEGRPLSYKGSHVDKNNTGKIGIVLIGDYHPGILNKHQPPEAQLESMAILIDVLQNAYGIENINMHRDYNDVMSTDTVCPGDTLQNIIDIMY